MCITDQSILNHQMNVQIAAFENELLKSKLLIVSTLGVKFGKDGNQYYYSIGDLPEKDCIIGFGDTPLKALGEFCKMYGI